MTRGLFIENLISEAELQSRVLKSDIEIASGFGSERRRCEFLTWRSIVYRELGFDVVIGYNSVGAPVISNIEGLYIAVSHCSTHVAVVISSNPCTVDIESTSRRFDRVTSRYISSRERELSDDTLFPAVMWCAKEALYKIAGVSGLDFIEDIHIESFDGESIVGRVKDGEAIDLSVKLFEDSQVVVVYLL